MKKEKVVLPNGQIVSAIIKKTYKENILKVIELINPTLGDLPIKKLDSEVILPNKQKVKGFITEFYEDNSLKFVELTEPQYIETPLGKLKLKQKLKFSPTGELIGFNLEKEQNLKTPVGLLKFSSINPIFLYKKGTFKSGILAFPQRINKIKHFDRPKIKNEIEFFENEQIKKFWLDISDCVSTSIGALFIKSETPIYFYENGNIENFYLNTDFDIPIINIEGNEISICDLVCFYDTEELKQIKLLKDTQINEIEFQKRTTLTLNKKGKITKIEWDKIL